MWHLSSSGVASDEVLLGVECASWWPLLQCASNVVWMQLAGIAAPSVAFGQWGVAARVTWLNPTTAMPAPQPARLSGGQARQ
jgi:hypothetical protein